MIKKHPGLLVQFSLGHLLTTAYENMLKIDKPKAKRLYFHKLLQLQDDFPKNGVLNDMIYRALRLWNPPNTSLNFN